MKKKINSQYFLLTSFASRKFQLNKESRSQIIFLKKFLSLGTLIFLLAISCFASPSTNNLTLNKRNGEKIIIKPVEGISILTKDQFEINFPKAANVRWTTIPGFSEADFTLGKSKMAAFYDFNNGLVGTGKYISYKELPAKGIENINRYFSNYSPEIVMYYNDNEQNENNMNLFGIFLDKNAYYALMKENNSNKEIVVQITLDGNASYFSDVK